MRKLTMMAAVVAIGSAGLVGNVGPVGASEGAVVVTGTQTVVEDGVAAMDGDLVGTWYTTVDWSTYAFTPSGAVRLSGTELFDGCYDADGSGGCDVGDPAGTISFSFTYTGRFDPVTGEFLHGRCHHPVTGGDGDFAHVSGVLTFHDESATCSNYQGNLRW